MRKLLIFIFILLPPCSAWSAAITTTGSGDYSSTTPNAPWRGGVIPTSGTDNVIVANRNTLTISDSRTVGDGTDSIKILNGGTLNQTGGTLTLNGTMNIMAETTNSAATFTQSAGVTLNAQTFNILTAQYASSATGWGAWNINGTSASRVTITGTTGKIDYKGIGYNAINWNYATFDGFLHSTDQNRVNGYKTAINIQYSLFKNGGSWCFGAGSENKAHTIDHNYFKNITNRSGNAPASGSYVAFNFNNSVTLNPTFSNNIFDTTPYIYISAKGVNLDGNVYYNSKVSTVTANATSTGILFYIPSGASAADYYSLGTSAGDLFYSSLFMSDIAYNSHIISSSSSTAVGAKVVVHGNVFQGANQEDNFIIGARNVPYEITNNITLDYGALYVSLNNAVGYAPQVLVKNNTCTAASGVYGSCWYNETAYSYEYDKVSSNLIVMLNTPGVASSAFNSSTAAAADNLNESVNNAFWSNGDSYFIRYRQGGTTGNMTFSAWTESSTPTYVDATHFTLAGDQTATYTSGVRLLINNTGVKRQTTVSSSSYSSPNTTVVLTSGYATVDLSSVSYSGGTSYATYQTNQWGVGDLTAEINPNFRDTSRTPDAFAVTKGATGTKAQKKLFLCTEQMKKNGFGYNGNSVTPPSWTVADVISYVQYGYTPTNMSLLTAGESGTYIGAIAPSPALTGVPLVLGF